MGIEYRFSENFFVNLVGMYAFEETLEETGTNPFGQPVTLESTLREFGVDVGFTWRF